MSFKNKCDLRVFRLTTGKLPEHGKYQILLFSKRKIHHEGDERSRTNPGHGYPAYTESVDEVEIYVFTNENDWKAAIEMFYREEPKRIDLLAQIIERVATATSELKIHIV